MQPSRRLTPRCAWDVVKRYCWPGNIRELRNVIESAFNVVQGEQIRRSDLPDYLLQAVARIPTRPLDLLAAAGLEGAAAPSPSPRSSRRWRST